MTAPPMAKKHAPRKPLPTFSAVEPAAGAGCAGGVLERTGCGAGCTGGVLERTGCGAGCTGGVLESTGGVTGLLEPAGALLSRDVPQ